MRGQRLFSGAVGVGELEDGYDIRRGSCVPDGEGLLDRVACWMWVRQVT